jgi:hypothetical protein
LNEHHIIASTPSKVVIYDVRKPSIILKDVYRSILSEGTTEENEINDFDFVKQGDS